MRLLLKLNSLLSQYSAKTRREKSPLPRAKNQLEAYRSSFYKLVDITKAIGLTEAEGIRWQFIAAARAMETQFKAHSEDAILIALLQLRRQEKNYMIRNTKRKNWMRSIQKQRN